MEGAVNFAVPVFKQRLALGASLQWDRLLRNDQTLFQYYPFNPNTGGNDPSAVALANATFAGGAGTYGSGSQVSWAPNYTNVRHWTTNLTAALPMTRQVTFSAVYNIQTFGGSYQTLSQNMAQSKSQGTAAVTYAIPNTQSSIQASVTQINFSDAVLPSFNGRDTSENFFFNIRF
jgi:hypothetical protein